MFLQRPDSLSIEARSTAAGNTVAPSKRIERSCIGSAWASTVAGNQPAVNMIPIATRVVRAAARDRVLDMGASALRRADAGPHRAARRAARARSPVAGPPGSDGRLAGKCDG